MKKSDKNLSKSAALGTVEALASSITPLAVAWALAKSLFGNAIALRQQKALEFVELIRDNPSVFTRTLLESSEFQDGFVVSLEDYLKLRLLLKRGAARKIFLDFATAQDKERFILERLNYTLRMITADGINFLQFIESNLVPVQEAETKKEISTIDQKSAGMDYSRLSGLVIKHHPLSMIFDDWLSMNGKQDVQVMVSNLPSISNPSITSSTGYMLSNTEKTHYEEAILELQSLGILKGHSYTVNSGGINETRKYWDYTDFGRQFVRYLEQPSV